MLILHSVYLTLKLNMTENFSFQELFFTQLKMWFRKVGACTDHSTELDSSAERVLHLQEIKGEKSAAETNDISRSSSI